MSQVFRAGTGKHRGERRRDGFAHGIVTYVRDEFVGVRMHNRARTEAHGQTHAPEEDETRAHDNGCIFRRHRLGITTMRKLGNILLAPHCTFTSS